MGSLLLCLIYKVKFIIGMYILEKHVTFIIGIMYMKNEQNIYVACY